MAFPGPHLVARALQTLRGMNQAIPSVRAYMTSFPHHIGPGEDLASAHRFMKERAIRHLPVLQDGALVGLLTLHDVRLLETLEDVYSGDTRIEYAMRKRVYAVTPETPLDEVIETMASKRIDCAVVVHNRHVVGIFTNVDLSRACVDLLRGRASEA